MVLQLAILLASFYLLFAIFIFLVLAFWVISKARTMRFLKEENGTSTERVFHYKSRARYHYSWLYSVTGRYLYTVGIINTLQTLSLVKKLVLLASLTKHYKARHRLDEGSPWEPFFR